jgi:hypothetical protein
MFRSTNSDANSHTFTNSDTDANSYSQSNPDADTRRGVAKQHARTARHSNHR